MFPSPSMLNLVNRATANSKKFANSSARSCANKLLDLDNLFFYKDMSALSFGGQIRSRNMCPMVITDNIANSLGRNVIERCDVFSVLSISNPIKNVYNRFIGQFSTTSVFANVMPMQASIVSVLNVFSLRSPLKVFNAVVCLNAVKGLP